MPKESGNSVFDLEEATEEEIKAMEKLTIANQSINEGLNDEIKKLGMQIEIEMAEIVGVYHDEIQLLNFIGGKFF